MLAYIGKGTLLNTDSIRMIFLEKLHNWKWSLTLKTDTKKEVLLAKYNDKVEAKKAFDKIKSALRDIDRFIDIVPDISD